MSLHVYDKINRLTANNCETFTKSQCVHDLGQMNDYVKIADVSIVGGPSPVAVDV